MNNRSFREQVIEFWKWFPSVSESIAESIKSDGELDVSGFSAQVQDKIGGLAWGFGPGSDPSRVSFTVTGEGQVSRQLLAHYWLSQSVSVPGWDFYCARQPAPPEQLADLSITVAGSSVDVQSLLVATDIDEDNQVVNVKVWNELFSQLDQDARLQITFLLLDEALGEYGTQCQLGSIEFKSDAAAKPLVELPGYLSELWHARGWETRSPLETYSGYRAEPTEGFVRSDSIAGYTCVPQVVVAYLNNQGVLEQDPIAGTGAQFMFVKLQNGGTEHVDDPMQKRTEVEDEISKRLAGGGYVIGGATGITNSYVDVVIFDGPRSLAAIEDALDQMALSAGHEILPFIASE